MGTINVMVAKRMESMQASVSTTVQYVSFLHIMLAKERAQLSTLRLFCFQIYLWTQAISLLLPVSSSMAQWLNAVPESLGCFLVACFIDGRLLCAPVGLTRAT